jgi:4-hydroxy-3-methylbut-2-enyl diphosphate reductase
MRIIRAGAMGMCFGVKDALEIARATERPEAVTIHGELVHNPDVLRELTGRGFAMSDRSDQSVGSDASRLPATPRVMITAHGVSDRERARLAAAGKELIDTTCPLVRRAHEAARMLARSGYFVVVVGKAGHVEVRGLTGDLEPGRYEIVGRPEEARRYDAERLGIVFQTTTAPADAQRIVDAIRAANPGKEILTVMTICRPTLDRQAAARSLLGQVEALVVVGGRDSNNTRQLVALARAHGKPALHVQGPDDLDAAWFAPFETVGLTAGTSTPDDAIEAVQRRLLEIARGHVSPRVRKTA